MKHPSAPLFYHAYRQAAARTLALSIARNNATAPAERERLLHECLRADIVLQAAWDAYYALVYL